MAKIIGLDTSVFIYLLEENPTYFASVERVLNGIQRGDVEGVFSTIGLIEVLTGPKKKHRDDLAVQYRELITNFPNLTIVGMNENIVEVASDLRAAYGIATPDAIHIATAIDGQADEFITNDRTLKRVREIRVRLLS